MSAIDKMKPGYQKLNGGLFGQTAKADVGDVAEQLIRQGVDLMSWADPFYPEASIPDPIVSAVIDSLKSGAAAHYTMPIGNSSLRQAISRKLTAFNGLDADPGRNIIITPGSDAGLLFAMMPFINPGDEVLVFDPSYPNNFLNPELLGGRTVTVPLHAANGYQPDIADLKDKLTDRSKMLLITNPNNPTTTVFRREKLLELAEVAVEHDLIVVVDQAFEDSVFEPESFVTFAALPGMWPRTVTVFSISKGMGLSGFRVGYVVADDVIMDKLYACCVNVLGATNTAAQVAAVAAFQNNGFVARYNETHDRRRRYAFEKINQVEGVSMLMPESAFFSWVNVSKLGKSADICHALITDAKVAANDGLTYGQQGEGYIRLVHGTFAEDQRSFAAVDRVCAALRSL